jgi:hypothetical protein
MRTESRYAVDPLQTLGLDPAQSALYTAVAEAMDGPADTVSRQLSDLVKLGVVDEQSGEYLARHPAGALGRLIAKRLDRLAEESRRIDSALGSIRALIRDYDAGRDSPWSWSAGPTCCTRAWSAWPCRRRRWSC